MSGMFASIGTHYGIVRSSNHFAEESIVSKMRFLRLLPPATSFLVLLLSVPAVGQIREGEVRVTVRDADGLAVQAAVELAGRNPQFEAAATVGADGQARLQRVPFGVHVVTVSGQGFVDYTDVVEVRSGVPVELSVVLQVPGLATTITVTGAAPLLDTAEPTAVMRVGRRQLEETPATTLGRSAVDVVTTLPGWLVEANAVLHPRGSEYDTQYVVDGMPVYDNRSIGFSPAFESSEFESVNVMTAGLPAEYGRRLGGVIALDTRRVGAIGHASEFDTQIGSFGNVGGSFRHQFSTDRTSVSIGMQGGATDRFLDPPSLENFTNKATLGAFNFRIDRDVTDRDRISVYVRSSESRFLVPNDLLQQAAGQRQDRFSGETSAQVHYHRTFDIRTLGSFRVMYRDLAAELWSNPQSTPVRVEQARGFQESVFVADLTVEGESHTLKFGGDFRYNNVREEFRFGETGEFQDFDVDFRDRQSSGEVSLFVQEQIRWGNFAGSFGVRYDNYDFLIEDDAVSPRVGLSYWIPRVDLQLRASYDRVFQPPPIENLLLSSAADRLGSLEGVEESVPVPASRGNFFEVGLRKPFFDAFRVDVTHYWRTFRNMIDDDVFLNTGLSFPITFDTARVQGTEVRLDMPSWRWFSSSVSYSNMIGWVTSPVTGGLFIEGGEADELRDAGHRFPISQDQRNTLSALLRFEPHERVWISAGVRYGSGLPVELDDDDDDDEGDNGMEVPGMDGDKGDDDDDFHDMDDDDGQPISPAILDRINFDRERVRSNFHLDFSLGLRLWEQQARSVTVQMDLRNMTDRLNVINFSGVFSGTALAAGRQFTVQTKVRF